MRQLSIPTPEEADAYLADASAMNPGEWIQHSFHAGAAARAIAAAHPKLDPDAAYVLGCLHDIGRREGRRQMRHVLDGYNFLHGEGHEDAARVCLTHSFPTRDVAAVFGDWDCTEEELRFIADYLAGVEYDEYDRLIQLCDGLALPSGCCLLEKRLVDVVLRYGPNEYLVPKWRAVMAIKAEFDEALGGSLYRFLPNVVENTFGFTP